MGLGNMIGLGFSFGYKDKGFEKGVAGAKKGLIDLKTAFSGVQSVANTLGSTLGKSLRLPSIAPAASAIQGIAGDMKVTTTNLEAFMVSADKITSKTFAGISLTGEELAKAKKKVAGIAYGLNMPVDAVAQGFAALVKAGTSAEKLGFKNFEEFMKWADVLGVDTKQLGGMVATLKNQFGMTDQEVGKLLESSTQLGKQFNMGGDAILLMAQNTAMLRQEGAGLWATLGPEKTAEYTRGIELLGAAFTDMYGDSEQGIALAGQVGKALVSTQKDMSRLYSGMETEITAVMKTLTEHGQDIGVSWELAQKDPMKFALAMAKMVKGLRESDRKLGVPLEETERKLYRFQAQLGESFSPEFSAMILSGNDKLISSLEKVDQEAAKLGDPTGSMAKAAGQYRSGLTAAELFARAQDQFRTSLKHVSKQLMTDSKFIKSYRTSTKLMLKEIGPLADDKGPLGQATRMLINFSYFGIGGVMSQLHPLGPALFSMIQQFGPIIQMMPGLVAAFTALASPITIVAAAIGFLAMYTKDSTGKFREVVDKILAKIPVVVKKIGDALVLLYPKVKEIVVTMAEKIAVWLKGLPWDKIGNTLGELFLGALAVLASLAKPIANVLIEVLKGAFTALKGVDWGAVGAVLLDLGKTLFTWLGKGLIAAAKGFGWLAEAFRNLDWDKVMSYVGEAAKMIFGLILKVSWEVLKALPDIVIGIMKAAWAAITGLWHAAMQAIDSSLGPWAGVVKTIIYGITAAAAVMFASMIAGFVTVQIKALASFIAIGAGATVAWLKILGPIALVVAAIYGVVKAVQWLKQHFGQLGVVIGGMALGAIGYFGKIKSVVGDVIGTLLSRMKLLAAGTKASAVVAQTSFAASTSKITADSLVSIGDVTGKATKSVGEVASKGTSSLGKMFSSVKLGLPVLMGIGIAASLIIANWDKITGWWEKLWGKQKSAAQKAADSIKKDLNGIADHAIKTAQQTQDAIDKIGKIDITGKQAKIKGALDQYAKVQEEVRKAEAKVRETQMYGAGSRFGDDDNPMRLMARQQAEQQLKDARKALDETNKAFEKELGASAGLIKVTLGDAIKMTERNFADAAKSDIGWLQAQNEVIRKSATEQLLNIEKQREAGSLTGEAYVKARQQVWSYISSQEAELTNLEQMSKWYEQYGNNANWISKNRTHVFAIEQQKMLDIHSVALNRLSGEERKKAEEYLVLEKQKYLDEMTGLYKQFDEKKINEQQLYTELSKLRDNYLKGTVKESIASTLQAAMGSRDVLGFLMNKMMGDQEAARAKEVAGAEAAEKAKEEAEKAAAGRELDERAKHYSKKTKMAIQNKKEIEDVVTSIDPTTADTFRMLFSIQPAEFSKKTKQLKDAYVGFITALEKESSGMLETTRNNFGKFLTEQEVFWKKMLDTLKNVFVDPSKTYMDSFWRGLIEQIGMKGREAVAALQQMYVDLGLAEPATQPGAVGAQTGSTRTPESTADTAAVRNKLLETINRPSWWYEYQKDYKKHNEAVLDHLDRLILVTGADKQYKEKLMAETRKEVGQNLGAGMHGEV